MTAYAVALLIVIAALLVIGGTYLGEALAHREARQHAHRRQILAGLNAVSAARGRHPSAR